MEEVKARSTLGVPIASRDALRLAAVDLEERWDVRVSEHAIEFLADVVDAFSKCVLDLAVASKEFERPTLCARDILAALRLFAAQPSGVIENLASAVEASGRVTERFLAARVAAAAAGA